MNKILVVIIAIVATHSAIVMAAVTVPNTFSNGQVADANDINENFQALANSIRPINIAYLRDERASGTASGTCYANVWTQRVLNTLGGDNSFITLSNNQFILMPGRYFVEADSPFAQAGMGQAKIRTVETGIDVLVGSIMFSGSSAQVASGVSHIAGEVIISELTTFELQHRCQIEKTTNGMGQTANFGVDQVFSQVKITKLE